MRLSRRSLLTGSAATLGALGAAAAGLSPGAAEAAALPSDVSRAIVDSTTTRFTPASFGDWSYHKALYLYGQYLVYKRTGEARYLDFIKAWVDRFVTDSGSTSKFNSLDSMRPAQLLPCSAAGSARSTGP
ncbi:glycoside hydrolase family 88 protein [Paractinoplanes brasiliensis]|uniref:glycoside hydrolase family 88 protein n=1 Tax=Paractinoplanes brasiliensis TaxID=52695 RepID=UPI001941119D|nr:glycoside hydrolase family 88 protein [Actinoplanes brasiliensis]